jgi:hypothetical protein
VDGGTGARDFKRACHGGRAAAGTAALRKLGHDADRAQLDLPDFFENLAGNHGKITSCQISNSIVKAAPIGQSK